LNFKSSGSAVKSYGYLLLVCLLCVYINLYGLSYLCDPDPSVYDLRR
jgi:hypothetical protein